MPIFKAVWANLSWLMFGLVVDISGCYRIKGVAQKPREVLCWLPTMVRVGSSQGLEGLPSPHPCPTPLSAQGDQAGAVWSGADIGTASAGGDGGGRLGQGGAGPLEWLGGCSGVPKARRAIVFFPVGREAIWIWD